MTVDAACYSITFGPNYHGVSGSPPTHIIDIATGAEQIYILGQQYISAGATSGVVDGPYNLYMGYAHQSFGSYIKTTQPQSAYRAFATVLASSTQTIIQTTDYTVMMIGLYNSNENYIYIGIVFNGILTQLARTNANLEVQISGTNVNIFNGTGATRTIDYWIDLL